MAGDYYERLGVSRDASPDEIKRAYRRRARELHPDANHDDPEAETRFKELGQAYEVLKDPDKRAHYDRFGEAGLGGAGGDPFGADIGDLFSAFFGGDGLFGQRGGGPSRGPDIEATVQLDFEDAVFGTEATVHVRTAVACERCDGAGAEPGTGVSRCDTCGGAGQVRQVRQSILGQVMTSGPCPTCGGLGERVESPCTECRGEGRVVTEREHRVDVPAGVDDGTTLRLRGRGAVGARGATPGDLFVGIRVRPHDRFRRDGVDLLDEVGIGMAQAALGIHLEYETLDGVEDLVVPPGTQPGRVFRLRGRGVPRLDGRGRGDLLVSVRVEVPTKLDGEAEEALREYASVRGEEVAPAEKGFFSRVRSAFR